ncbi:MAG: dihydroneopterin aldolase [Bacteroidetes bacterium]|nr:dihydroneopterin aldolase [Bacteroidota bacterium]
MITVELHNLIIHGYHGVFEEEKKVMNTFEVNLSVKFEERKSDFQRLDDTISYVDLYEIVKQKTQVPALLLEKLCQGIIRKIKHQYPIVKEVVISIYKLQAPIENFQGKVGVTMRKKFDD